MNQNACYAANFTPIQAFQLGIYEFTGKLIVKISGYKDHGRIIS